MVRPDRRDFRPYGLYGGGPGKPSMNYLNPEQNADPLPSKLTMNMKKGDLFRHEVAGAGGWGDPLERDPALVLKDVRNEFVSLDAARGDPRCRHRHGRGRRSQRPPRCAARCATNATGLEAPTYSWGMAAQ